jgi:hypothetical protein
VPQVSFSVSLRRQHELSTTGINVPDYSSPRWNHEDTGRDYCTARIWTNDSILVGIPAFSFDLVHFPDGFRPDCGEGAWKAMDAARHTFIHDKTRHIKYFVLKFPVPPDSQTGRLEFSTKELYDCDDETELELLYPYIEARHPKHPYKMQNQYASWNVVRLDVDPKKRGCPEFASTVSKAQQAVLRKEIALHEEAKAAATAAAEAKLIAEAIEQIKKSKGRQPDHIMSG